MSKLESDFLPSELKMIIEKVENLNPFFVNMLTRLLKLGREMSG